MNPWLVHGPHPPLINSRARTFDLGKSPLGYVRLYHALAEVSGSDWSWGWCERNLHNICRNIFRTQIAASKESGYGFLTSPDSASQDCNIIIQIYAATKEPFSHALSYRQRAIGWLGWRSVGVEGWVEVEKDIHFLANGKREDWRRKRK